MSVERAVSLDALAPGAIADGEVSLVNPLHALGGMRRHTVLPAERQRLSQGRSLDASETAESTSGSHVVFVDEHDQVLGIGELMHGESGAFRWQPRVLLDTTALVGGA